MLSHLGNGCWSQPLVIYIRYIQAKWVVGHVWLSCKMFLLNSSVSFLEYTDRKVIPYLVIVGNPLPNTCLRFWLYTIYVEREMKAFLLDDYCIVVDRQCYNIRMILLCKNVWILIRKKPVPYSRRGLMRYHIPVLNDLSLFTPVTWLTRSLFVVFPKLLGA